jgi:glutamate 5-kinase
MSLTQSSLVRREIINSAETLVIKVGTSVVAGEDGGLDEQRITQLADEIHAFHEAGKRVVLVSSGAVGAGIRKLGWTSRPSDVAQLQAVAAVGQTRLVEIYERLFRRHDRHAAQVLLTADDLEKRERYLNLCNTINALFQMGAVPVINENDTVAVDELMATFGDNDRLAAGVANAFRAALLIILSDVEGLYDGDPDIEGTRIIPTVDEVNREIEALVLSGRGTGRGGMSSKLEAARQVTAAGGTVIVASGRRPGILAQILDGAEVGTLFLAKGKIVPSRKRWAVFSTQPTGRIHVDQGACRALIEKGRSLLSVGVVKTTGEFRKGDVVSIISPDGSEVARGLTNYHSEEVRQIRGMKSEQIARVLKHRPYLEVLHRDNLIVLTNGEPTDLRSNDTASNETASNETASNETANSAAQPAAQPTDQPTDTP